MEEKMKKILLALSLLLVASNIQATHHLTYFVYVESYFPQGYWKDAEMTFKHGGVFLYPHQYTDLFGTVKEDFYKKLLQRLEEHHDFYARVQLDNNRIKNDNHREYYDTLKVALGYDLSDDQLRTVRNELIATVIAAGECEALRLNHYNADGKRVRTETLDYRDLDYPLFELVSSPGEDKAKTSSPEKATGQAKPVPDTIYQVRRDTVKVEDPGEDAGGSVFACWDRYLWWAIILVLAVLLWRKMKG